MLCFLFLLLLEDLVAPRHQSAKGVRVVERSFDTDYQSATKLLTSSSHPVYKAVHEYLVCSPSHLPHPHPHFLLPFFFNVHLSKLCVHCAFQCKDEYDDLVPKECILKRYHLETPEARVKFEKELNLLCGLQHPNVLAPEVSDSSCFILKGTPSTNSLRASCVD
jgi:hypothetical protein